MNAYFSASNLSNHEKEDILKQHRTLYDGYRTLQPHVNNQQPLYVQDFAKDKDGIVVNNKGVVKPYTNFGINEQVEEVCDECGVRDMFEEEQMCSECGGMMAEGECSECGWKGEVGAMEEQHRKVGKRHQYTEEAEMCSECGSEMMEGECMECGWKGDMEEGYKTGHLDDIYNVNDLGDSDFDYVEGGGNDYGTFEKMHHMRGIKNEQIEDDYEDPDNEDDGFEDLEVGSSEMYEQGYTGGGNAPDMDISNVDPAYDFKSDGPEMGDEPYIDAADDMDLDSENEWDAYDFESNGPDSVYPTEGEMEEEKEYETMESAWLYNYDGELDEANDISGVQGIYGDMEPAYDFDSNGPGSAGPYQRSSWGGGAQHSSEKPGYEGEDEDAYWQADLEPNELEVDFEKLNPRQASWGEIQDYTGDWEEIDEDIKESFEKQRERITEMMIRMKVI